MKARRKVAIDIWDELPKFAAKDVRPIIGDLRDGLGALRDARFNIVLASNLLEHFEPDVTSQIVRDVFLSMSRGNFINIQQTFAMPTNIILMTIRIAVFLQMFSCPNR